MADDTATANHLQREKHNEMASPKEEVLPHL